MFYFISDCCICKNIKTNLHILLLLVSKHGIPVTEIRMEDETSQPLSKQNTNVTFIHGPFRVRLLCGLCY